MVVIDWIFHAGVLNMHTLCAHIDLVHKLEVSVYFSVYGLTVDAPTSPATLKG